MEKKIQQLISIILFFLFFSGFTNGRAQNSFDKKFLHPPIFCQLTQIDSTGNIYVAGVDNNYQIIVMKLDSAGNLIWDKVIGVPNKANVVYDMTFIQGNRLVLLGAVYDGFFSNYYQADIFCIDHTGQILFSETFGNNVDDNAIPINIIRDSTGFTVAINYYNAQSSTNGLRVVKYDNNGQIILQKRLDFMAHHKLLKKSDGSYLLYSSDAFEYIQMDQNFNNAHFVSNLCSNFQFMISDATQLILNSDTDYFALGSCFIAGAIGHIKQNLQVEWLKLYQVDSLSNDPTYFLDMHKVNDHSWLILGFVPHDFSNDTCNFFILHVDSSFSPIRLFYLHSGLFWDPNFNLTKTAFTPDNSIIFTANHYDPINITGFDFEVIKTDTNFQNICSGVDTTYYFQTDSTNIFTDYFPFSDTSLIVTDTLILAVNDFFPAFGDCSDSTVIVESINYSQTIIGIYPNPFREYATVAIVSDEKNLHFEITDVFGKTFFRKTLNENSFRIERDHLPAGIYFYSLKNNTGFFRNGKIVIE